MGFLWLWQTCAQGSNWLTEGAQGKGLPESAYVAILPKKEKIAADHQGAAFWMAAQPSVLEPLGEPVSMSWSDLGAH